MNQSQFVLCVRFSLSLPQPCDWLQKDCCVRPLMYEGDYLEQIFTGQMLSCCLTNSIKALQRHKVVIVESLTVLHPCFIHSQCKDAVLFVPVLSDVGTIRIQSQYWLQKYVDVKNCCCACNVIMLCCSHQPLIGRKLLICSYLQAR